MGKLIVSNECQRNECVRERERIFGARNYNGNPFRDLLCCVQLRYMLTIIVCQLICEQNLFCFFFAFAIECLHSIGMELRPPTRKLANQRNIV